MLFSIYKHHTAIYPPASPAGPTACGLKASGSSRALVHLGVDKSQTYPDLRGGSAPQMLASEVTGIYEQGIKKLSHVTCTIQCDETARWHARINRQQGAGFATSSHACLMQQL
jgi:hypothetical protein